MSLRPWHSQRLIMAGSQRPPSCLDCCFSLARLHASPDQLRGSEQQLSEDRSLLAPRVSPVASATPHRTAVGGERASPCHITASLNFLPRRAHSVGQSGWQTTSSVCVLADLCFHLATSSVAQGLASSEPCSVPTLVCRSRSCWRSLKT